MEREGERERERVREKQETYIGEKETKQPCINHLRFIGLLPKAGRRDTQRIRIGLKRCVILWAQLPFTVDDPVVHTIYSFLPDRACILWNH
ncbi:hypothetical protein H6P81_012777 [Aristolochia fimbriata]|uniref:Uncharacterized protein n=1 Tax=Aristolochia fimbriata TaxID=158543 RepID=A0AAV7EEC2_ARIFI|nr:hypothetical protein H6P81_012777 [Aristolochia fimbriata]